MTAAHTLYQDADEFDPEAPEPVFVAATEERMATLAGYPASGLLVLLVLLLRVGLSFAFHALRHAWSPNAAAAMEPFPASDVMPAFLSSGVRRPTACAKAVRPLTRPTAPAPSPLA